MTRVVGSPKLVPSWTRETVLIIMLIIIADSILIVDYQAITVTLPSIGTGLNATPSQLQWIISGYSLAVAGLVIIGGRLTDAFGEGRSYFIGCLLCAIGILLATASPSITLLIVARCIQGMAAAILIPTSLSLIASRFADGPARLRVLAIHVSIGVTIGPLGTIAAGMLITQIGWQGGFLVLLPFPILGMILGYPVLGIAKRPGSIVQSINWGAAIIATMGLSLLVWSISGIFTSLSSPPMGSLLALGAAIIILLGLVLQQKTASNPLVPPTIWHHRNFAKSMFLLALLNISFSGGFALIQMSLQRAAGFTPLESALMNMPKSVLAVFLGFLVIPRSTKFLLANSFYVLLASMAGIAASQVAMSYASLDYSTVVTFLIPMLIISAGYVFSSSIIMREMFRHVPAGEHGLAAALFNATRFVFMAIGISMIISVVSPVRGGAAMSLSTYATSYRVCAGFAALSILAAIFLLWPNSGTETKRRELNEITS